MADRLEIIDQHIIVDVQLFANQRRADDPWIVGEADDLALRRPSYGDRDAARQAPALPALEILPCGLEARMIRSEEHTSELQSLMRNSYAVFCLKKKTTQTRNNILE